MTDIDDLVAQLTAAVASVAAGLADTDEGTAIVVDLAPDDFYAVADLDPARYVDELHAAANTPELADRVFRTRVVIVCADDPFDRIRIDTPIHNT
ncbi:MAG: hypothetical protein S0880_13195 [Actinomycetota bacterium]|nr:hypothetical protein [Actinomycetota bacterium]